MLMTTLLPYLDGYPNIGDTFRTKRLELGTSMDDVSAHLGVSRFYVIGLESNRLDLLPTVAETRALISRYSKLLDLDSQSILTRFNAWLDSCPVSEPTPADVTLPPTTYGGLKAAAIAGLLLLIPATTNHLVNNDELTINTAAETESNIATLEFTISSTASENTAATLTSNTADASARDDFAPKPYSDKRNADDIERDRLFYIQEQIRLGLEPVALPYRG